MTSQERPSGLTALSLLGRNIPVNLWLSSEANWRVAATLGDSISQKTSISPGRRVCATGSWHPLSVEPCSNPNSSLCNHIFNGGGRCGWERRDMTMFHAPGFGKSGLSSPCTLPFQLPHRILPSLLGWCLNVFNKPCASSTLIRCVGLFVFEDRWATVPGSTHGGYHCIRVIIFHRIGQQKTTCTSLNIYSPVFPVELRYLKIQFFLYGLKLKLQLKTGILLFNTTKPRKLQNSVSYSILFLWHKKSPNKCKVKGCALHSCTSPFHLNPYLLRVSFYIQHLVLEVPFRSINTGVQLFTKCSR